MSKSKTQNYGVVGEFTIGEYTWRNLRPLPLAEIDQWAREMKARHGFWECETKFVRTLRRPDDVVYAVDLQPRTLLGARRSIAKAAKEGR